MTGYHLVKKDLLLLKKGLYRFQKGLSLVRRAFYSFRKATIQNWLSTQQFFCIS